MKKRKIIISVCILTLILTTGVSAISQKLSPALDNIAAESAMIKTGTTNEVISFKKEDFTNYTGVAGKAITITSLPPSSDGKLMLGTSEVSIGQTISWTNLGILRFVRNENTSESSFRFTTDKSYVSECIIKICDTGNSSPNAAGAGMTTITQSDITCNGILEGSDPDGDSLLFEIMEYPSNGVLTLSDNKSGAFTYTPFEDYSGVDSFSYRVRDDYGNYSENCTVSLRIDERSSELTLSDMEGHWAHSAALTMVEGGYMNAISENGKLYFDPDENITREEYLYSVMKALGADDLSPVETVFADNDDITPKHTGYVAAAYKLGIINGIKADGGYVFEPQRNITRAEAAAILNNILGAAKTTDIPKFSDDEYIPSWVKEDIYALASIGILNGNGNNIYASDCITRAEAAHILYTAKNIYS